MSADDKDSEQAKQSSAEQVRQDVVRPAAADARDYRAHRWMYLAAAFALAGILGLSALWLVEAREIAALQAQVADRQDRGNRTAVVAQELAVQVRSMGATPVVSPPSPSAQGPQGLPGLPGPAGQPGAAGAPGRGITSTSLAGGHLVVVYADGQTADLGVVAGKDGTPGPAGRSITATSLTNGHLVVAYSDNTATDVGTVVGKDGATGATGAPGRGVQSVTINSASHLIVTYTDGSTADAGQVPPGPTGSTGQQGPTGPRGATGPQGAPPTRWTWTDELGREQTCTRSGGSDASPTYTCTTQPPLNTK